MKAKWIASFVAVIVMVGNLVAADKEINGKIVNVDAAKKKLTVHTADGNKEYAAGAELKVFGPKGAESDDGLRDDLLVPGTEVKVVVAGNNRTLKEIHVIAKAEGRAPREHKAVAREIHGKIIHVDAGKKTLSVMTDDGKKDFIISHDTKVIGPRETLSDDGIKDHRLTAGANVDLVMGANGKAVKEVHLATAERTRTPTSARRVTPSTSGSRSDKTETAEEHRNTREITGKVVKVDHDKKTITVMNDEGRKQEFDVEKETQFIGPRGGVSDERLKDDRLTEGYEIRVVFDANGKTVREVHLPYRHSNKEKDK